MHNDELKTPKDIEIKFHRLLLPSSNVLNTTLCGVYNPIDNIESPEFSLINKFKDFDIPSNKAPNIQNLFSINQSFGDIFINEQLEALITFINISENIILIKDINVVLERYYNILKNMNQPIDIQLPNDTSIILPKKGYTIKIKTSINYEGKYKITIFYTIKSKTYDQDYSKLKQKYNIKENSNYYTIKGGSPEFFILKKLKFDAINPFKVSEKFHFLQENKSLIEIKISNNTKSNSLTLLDVFLTPKINRDITILLIQNLEQINKNKYGQNGNDSKYMTIQPEEQIILLFKIDNVELFYNENKFELNLSWLNNFDFNPKIYTYEFNNSLKTYNKYYKIVIIEKPKEDIILNEDFKVSINVTSKNLDHKYIIKISQQPNITNDKSNSEKVEIIDINERKIELNYKTPSSNFVLICKSSTLGKVFLAKLKLSLYEKDKIMPVEFIYEDLLSFNCISKEKNSIKDT